MSETTRPEVIESNGRASLPVRPDWRWHLYANLSPPEFMQVAFILIHGGSETFLIQAPTRESLDAVFAELANHPRLRRIEVKHEGAVVEMYDHAQARAHVKAKEPRP